MIVKEIIQRSSRRSSVAIAVSLVILGGVAFSGALAQGYGGMVPEPFKKTGGGGPGCAKTEYKVPETYKTVQAAVEAVKKCGPGKDARILVNESGAPYQGSVIIDGIRRDLDIIGVDDAGAMASKKVTLVPDVGRTCIDFKNKDQRITIAIKNINFDAHDLFKETCVKVESGRTVLSQSSVELHKNTLPAVKIVGGTATIEDSFIEKGSAGVLIEGWAGDGAHEIHDTTISGSTTGVDANAPTNVVASTFKAAKRMVTAIRLSGGGSAVGNDIQGKAFDPEKHSDDFSSDKSAIIIDALSGKKKYTVRNNVVSGGHGYGVFLRRKVEGGELSHNKLTDVPSCGIRCAADPEGKCLAGDFNLSELTRKIKDKDEKKAAKAELRKEMCGFKEVIGNETRGGKKKRCGWFRRHC